MLEITTLPLDKLTSYRVLRGCIKGLVGSEIVEPERLARRYTQLRSGISWPGPYCDGRDCMAVSSASQVGGVQQRGIHRIIGNGFARRGVFRVAAHTLPTSLQQAIEPHVGGLAFGFGEVVRGVGGWRA